VDFSGSAFHRYARAALFIGMYMRLGFSIAVNVDPDILLIDEIFAVGDLKFQEQCIDRINDFKARQKTILLVSHDLGAIRSLCSRLSGWTRARSGKSGRSTRSSISTKPPGRASRSFP